MIISNIQELKEFILSNDLSKGDIHELLKITLNVWLIFDYEKIELAEMIEEFYYKYPNINSRPLFLDKDPLEPIKISDFKNIIFET